MVKALRCNEIPTPHGFFTRIGGVSVGPYASLNCSLSSADERESVLENRSRAVRAIGGDPTALVAVTQVHSPDVVHVTAPWQHGEAPKADAMVTDRPMVVLGIVTADCAPVLFADPAAGVVGAAHAGWRGAVKGVLDATVAAMVRIGARPERISAAIGPCIGVLSYEVGADLRDTVIEAAGDDRYFSPGKREGHWQFDLRAYCRARLERAGVAGVYDAEADTVTGEQHFFSHRRRVLAGGGPIGHQISMIRLG
ncbi:MAG: peptidoglycan editing factor PgeF [Acetobacteraceae bacterium]|nr:peptidoglycan editing factor PgeF [Acetobacteraceae bacterium]